MADPEISSGSPWKASAPVIEASLAMVHRGDDVSGLSATDIIAINKAEEGLIYLSAVGLDE